MTEYCKVLFLTNDVFIKNIIIKINFNLKFCNNFINYTKKISIE